MSPKIKEVPKNEDTSPKISRNKQNFTRDYY